jgi:uncharacterized protein YodC (DUF2158 family)
MDIHKGSTVVLKSGGPKMIVTEIEKNGLVRCTWFEKKILKCGNFQISDLKKKRVFFR